MFSQSHSRSTLVSQATTPARGRGPLALPAHRQPGRYAAASRLARRGPRDERIPGLLRVLGAVQYSAYRPRCQTSESAVSSTMWPRLRSDDDHRAAAAGLVRHRGRTRGARRAVHSVDARVAEAPLFQKCGVWACAKSNGILEARASEHAPFFRCRNLRLAGFPLVPGSKMRSKCPDSADSGLTLRARLSKLAAGSSTEVEAHLVPQRSRQPTGALSITAPRSHTWPPSRRACAVRAAP